MRQSKIEKYVKKLDEINLKLDYLLMAVSDGEITNNNIQLKIQKIINNLEDVIERLEMENVEEESKEK